jgi:hypothetical protein
MTSYEISQLVIGSFAAVGTVGAVCLSLWYNRPNKAMFKILAAEARVMHNTAKVGGGISSTERYVLVKLQNRQNFQMQIFKAMIDCEGSGTGVQYKNEFIPPLGTYNIKIDYELKNNKDIFDKIKETQKVSCTVNTSFGDKTYSLNKEETKILINHLNTIKPIQEKAA